MIVWQKPNLLLLDEPTNHLDLDMRHALTIALQSFQGALIVVSHDRTLLESTSDSLIYLNQGSLHHFNGDLNNYRQWRLSQEQNNAEFPQASTDSVNRKEQKRQDAQQRQQRARQIKPLLMKIEKVERDIELWQKQQQQYEQFLSSEDAYLDENKTNLQQTITKLAEVKVKLAQLEEKWLEWQQQIEAIDHT